MKPWGEGTATRWLKSKNFVHQLVRYYENKLPTLANQNWKKNQQNWLINKKSLDIFLQESDVTEHDKCQVYVDDPRLRFPLEGKGTATLRRGPHVLTESKILSRSAFNIVDKYFLRLPKRLIIPKLC